MVDVGRIGRLIDGGGTELIRAAGRAVANGANAARGYSAVIRRDPARRYAAGPATDYESHARTGKARCAEASAAACRPRRFPVGERGAVWHRDRECRAGWYEVGRPCADTTGSAIGDGTGNSP
jgi:hypothetical protein